MTPPTYEYHFPSFPIWELVNPRRHTLLVISIFVICLVVDTFGMTRFGWQLWQATALTLAVMILAMIPKWRDDLRRYGLIAMMLSVLLMAQGFHMVEHLVQWAQYYVLNYTMQNAVGLLSPANTEWVHFVWNWTVLILIGILIGLGMRSNWSWALFIYGIAHTTDHTYLLIRFIQMSDRLKVLCGTNIPAQGLPGIIGQGGWLAQSDLTRGTWISRIPLLTTAIRLDVHFWWNMGETVLLLLAAHAFLSTIFHKTPVSAKEAGLPVLS